MSSVTINKDLCTSFKVSKVFSHTETPPITSLDYDDSGQFLISTSVDECIQLYDITKGKHVKPVYSKKYGCHLAKFTHNQKNCIYASTKGDDNTIRYLSLSDNSYIRYFRGHKGFVNSLEVSPKSDVFVSASLDHTTKLWDLRASNPQASIPSTARSSVAFDPSGEVVALSNVNEGVVKFLNVKMFDAEPFYVLQLPKGYQWDKVEFSNDSKFIMLSSSQYGHLLYDSFEFLEKGKLDGFTPIPQNEFASNGCASFTPDGKYVFSGNGLGNVCVWSLNPLDNNRQPVRGNVKPLAYLKGDARPRLCLWNPCFAQFTTADVSISMWIPEEAS